MAVLRYGKLARTYRGRSATSAQLAVHYRNQAAGLHAQAARIGIAAWAGSGRRTDRWSPHDAGAGEARVFMLREDERRSKVLADHHFSLAAKYRAASERPWIAVPPDPPEPE
jgi:hypothetical protein